ncbi:c-type cytochrome [Chitinimonas lacunae]|uniref:C-type cytochrome n=1 Tax=Chitinimonas lacunae TaxID=1963018 RepID=A0ABV8MUA2_9NEIS
MRHLSAVCLTLLAAQVAAADLAAGRAKAEQVCAACHKIDGNSDNPQYPVLAGQHADYLRRALHDYRNGSRNNGVMLPYAQALSRTDIDNVSAWFASQPSRLVSRP